MRCPIYGREVTLTEDEFAAAVALQDTGELASCPECGQPHMVGICETCGPVILVGVGYSLDESGNAISLSGHCPICEFAKRSAGLDVPIVTQVLTAPVSPTPGETLL